MPPCTLRISSHTSTQSSRLQSPHNLFPLLLIFCQYLKSIYEAGLHAHETLDETHILYCSIMGRFLIGGAEGAEGVFVGCD